MTRIGTGRRLRRGRYGAGVNDLVLRRVVAEGRAVDVSCAGGLVVAVDPAGTGPAAAHELDLPGRLVLAAPAEPHAHLDKALTADTVANPDGDLAGAIEAWARHHDDRTVAEIVTRASVALGRLVRSGATAVRTHVDCGPGIDLRAVDALVEVRERFASVVHLEICALVAPPLGGPDSAAALTRLDAAIDRGIDLVGGAPYADPDPRRATALLLDRAATAGLDVDLHTDETLDPATVTLADLAELASGFPGRITASHCCSLGMLEAPRQAELAAIVAEAGIGVVTLPATNLFLQSRGRPTAPPRGLTAIAALRAAGVAVAAGADNLQDPFCTVGRADPLETAGYLVTAGHVEAAAAWEMVGPAARDVLGLAPAGPLEGAVADLLVLPARGVRAAVADAPAERMVVRAGRVVATTTVQVESDPLLG